MLDQSTDRRVLFFGDSHTAGVGDPAGLGWVGRLVEASFRAGVPLTAYNLGVRMETSVDVQARWITEARPRLSPDAASRVVFSFGVNDTTIDAGVPRVAPETSIGALGTTLEDAETLELAVLVVGPALVSDKAQNQRIESLSRRFEELCKANRVSFINLTAALIGSDLWHEALARGDGAHPGREGYELLAELILQGGWLDWLTA